MKVTSEVSVDKRTGQPVVDWSIDIRQATASDLPEIERELAALHGTLTPVLLGELGIYRALRGYKGNESC